MTIIQKILWYFTPCRQCKNKDVQGVVSCSCLEVSLKRSGGRITVEDNKTYINKAMLCPTCKVPMLQCQYYGGGIYWTCGKCGCRVDSTGL